ncbi:MAG: BACON domain-containing protein [Candidatus Cryptobacteroides sp.]|nr:BACON domain-containing protein [Bacteroidales bacterium]
MKHNILLAFAIGGAIMSATACNDDEEIFYAPQVTLETSSREAFFPVEGGQKTVFVSSNASSWSYECEEDWLIIIKDNDRLIMSADKNLDPDSRTAVITISASADPETGDADKNNAVKRFKLIQAGNSVVDLSAAGTANCYMAGTSVSCSFSAKVKGNGKGDGYSKYIDAYGVDIKDAVYADLLWEATYDADRTRSGKIIDGSPVYDSATGTVWFKTGPVEGNAVIAVCKADGEVIWSWHIWVTDKPVATKFFNNVEWMDRNLGALNNTPGDIANRGTFYQWGRKDPFMPSTGEYIDMPRHDYSENSNETAEQEAEIDAELAKLRPLANVFNTQVGDGSAKWVLADYVPNICFTAPGNIPQSVSHPTTFFQCQSSSLGDYIFDWYLVLDKADYSGDNDRVFMQSHSHLWGESEVAESNDKPTVPQTGYKSIFDPCPPGYVVPTQGSYATVGADQWLDLVTDDWVRADYGYVWTKGTGDYFPCAGGMDVSGRLRYTGEDMMYWSAKELDNVNYGKAGGLVSLYHYVAFGAVYENNPFTDFYSFGARCWAAPIRCVKE